MKMKKLLKCLLVVMLMAFISVKAASIPKATISSFVEYIDGEEVTVKKNASGIYALSDYSGEITYTVDSYNPEYCLAVVQRNYTEYEGVGKVSRGWGTVNDPICSDYANEHWLNPSFWYDETNLEYRIGFVKKTDWDAFEAEHEHDYDTDWSNLELYGYTSVLVSGIPHQESRNAEFTALLDKDKKEVQTQEGSYREYIFTPGQKYYFRFKVLKSGVTQLNTEYTLNGEEPSKVTGTATVSGGFVDVPITFSGSEQGDGVVNITVGNFDEVDWSNYWSETAYVYYELSTKKTAKLGITYKSGTKIDAEYGLRFDANEYNSSKPVTLNIELKNFNNSEYNANIRFMKESWNEEAGDYIPVKLYEKTAKLYSGKVNNVLIDGYVPTIDLEDDSWYYIEIDVDGVKTTYTYFYNDGLIYSTIYDTAGRQILQTGGYGGSSTTYSSSFYQKSPALANNIYMMFGGSKLDNSKNYSYKIFTVKDEGEKTLLTSGKYTGKEFNEKNIFVNVKVPTGVTKLMEVIFELYNSDNKLVYVDNSRISYENKTSIYSFIADTTGLETGAYGYYQYISTGLDSHNMKILGVGYDESKTYGYLITDNNEGKYIMSGTITGKELNAGKIIKVNKKITDFAHFEVNIFEHGEDIVRNFDVHQSSAYMIETVTSAEFTKIAGLKHFETNPSKVLELMKSTSDNTAKLVGVSESTTPSNPSTPTTPTVVANLDEFKITSVGTKNVKLSWNKVSGAKGYIVYNSTNGKKWKKLTTTKKNTVLTYNNKKLKPGTKYYFKVVAYKVVKKKNKTIVTSKVLNTRTVPAVPKAKIKTSAYNSVTVNVGKVTGASKYVIERSTDKKTYAQVGELTKAGNYKDTNVVTGTKYYYRVKACNERCGGYSKVVSAKPSLKKPTLKLVAGKKKVTIKIPGVSGADGYVIVKSTKKNKGFAEVANVDYATKTFDEEYLKSKKTYYYKVRAYKLVNEKPVYSAYSKVYKVKVK